MDLQHFPAIDQHAHNVLKPESAARLSYPAAYTESHDNEVIERHARHTLCYRRSLRDMAKLFGCEENESAITQRRDQLGLEELSRFCCQAANLDAILLDDGFLPDEILPVEWHSQFVPSYRLLRIEWLAEGLMEKATSFDSFLDAFRGALDPPPENVVGLKSIASYRTGLEIKVVSREVAAARFGTLRDESKDKPVRLADKTLLDFLFLQALEVAAKRKLPMQLHTGFGDPDLDLRLSNPLHLRSVLENIQFRDVPIILLHAGYPYVRECGFLASVYPNVYLDYGLAIPLLSVTGMRTVVGQLLELAPFTKLMYSSDAHFIPELFYMAAKWGRQILGQVLDKAIKGGDLSATEAEEVAGLVLAGNARALYGLAK